MNDIMSTLKYAILGLLNRKSMTGYELKKEFETTLFEFWNAKYSQIYPELKDLYDNKLVNFNIEVSGNVLQKKLYYITESGKKYFYDWIAQLDNKYVIQKDEFKLKLYFSDLLNKDERNSLLLKELEIHSKALMHFKTNLLKFDNIPPSNDTDFVDYLVLLGGIKREEMVCEWLKECLSLCQNRK